MKRKHENSSDNVDADDDDDAINPNVSLFLRNENEEEKEEEEAAAAEEEEEDEYNHIDIKAESRKSMLIKIRYFDRNEIFYCIVPLNCSHVDFESFLIGGNQDLVIRRLIKPLPNIAQPGDKGICISVNNWDELDYNDTELFLSHGYENASEEYFGLLSRFITGLDLINDYFFISDDAARFILRYAEGTMVDGFVLLRGRTQIRNLNAKEKKKKVQLSGDLPSSYFFVEEEDSSSDEEEKSNSDDDDDDDDEKFFHEVEKEDRKIQKEEEKSQNQRKRIKPTLIKPEDPENFSSYSIKDDDGNELEVHNSDVHASEKELVELSKQEIISLASLEDYDLSLYPDKNKDEVDWDNDYHWNKKDVTRAFKHHRQNHKNQYVQYYRLLKVILPYDNRVLYIVMPRWMTWEEFFVYIAGTSDQQYEQFQKLNAQHPNNSFVIPRILEVPGNVPMSEIEKMDALTIFYDTEAWGDFNDSDIFYIMNNLKLLDNITQIDPRNQLIRRALLEFACFISGHGDWNTPQYSFKEISKK